MFAAQTLKPPMRPEAQRAAAGEPAIDLVHLARQTDGDTALEAELLAMFDSQAAKLIARLRQIDGEPQVLADIAHRLRGSALAIGANRVAVAAEAVENHFERVAAGGPACEAPLGPLNRAVEDARAQIASLQP